jgi:RNA polymerase sigma-70 factor (ECF subfamily)
VRQRCADPAVVADVVDDTFLVVWEKPGKYAGQGEVAAWLWGIAIRTLLHRLRPRKSVVERLASLRQDHTPSAEEAVLLAVEHSDVGAALARLSPELVAVVQATVIDGLSTREAATLLGIPSGTVKSRMSRARSELREALS